MQEVNVSNQAEKSKCPSPVPHSSQSSVFQPFGPYNSPINHITSGVYGIPSVLQSSIFFSPPRMSNTPSIPSSSTQSEYPIVDLSTFNKFSPTLTGSDLAIEPKTSLGDSFPGIPYSFPSQKSLFDPTRSSFRRSGYSRVNDDFLTFLLASSKGPQPAEPRPFTSQSKSLSTDRISQLRELFLKGTPLTQENFSPSVSSTHLSSEIGKSTQSAFKAKRAKIDCFSNMSVLGTSDNGNHNHEYDSKLEITTVDDDYDNISDKTSENQCPKKQLFNHDSLLSDSSPHNKGPLQIDSDSDKEGSTDRKFRQSTETNCEDMDNFDANSDKSRAEMYETFQAWAIKNYGDSGKTKTITRNKYRRIIRILSGEEFFTAENSKFRFWVKAKGFQLSTKTDRSDMNGEKTLLVPSKDGLDSRGGRTLKRVAVVENFFDIIYNAHVATDGRGGKHAGQKRTFRAIAKTYSFLPREAVTRFLMACNDCQKRMHLCLENNNNNNNKNNNASNNDNKSNINGITSSERVGKINDDAQTPEYSILKGSSAIDYFVPITQTYLNRMRHSSNPMPYSIHHDEDSMSSDSTTNRDASPSPRTEEESMDALPRNTDSGVEEPQDMSSRKASPQCPELEMRPSELPIDLNNRKASPISGKLIEGKSHNERKRRASSESGDSAMTKTSEGKDDDDDDDNDDDERMPVGHNIDPERLKSFNMFVRLFVDENLDRMVPISKQPKDKVQAILEACDRQFPEFHERSRKRIRTYLKSCRRMRRSKDHNGWEPLRPTPPHLTSAAAESLLATACENESQNAKRMRMGLEPLTAAEMAEQNLLTNAQTTPTTQQQPSLTGTPVTPNNNNNNNNNSTSNNNNTNNGGSQTPSQPTSRPVNCSVPTATDFLRHQTHPTAFHPTADFTPSFFTNGHGTAAAAAALFRPGFPGYQHPAHHHPSVLQHSSITPTANTNGEFGPTDLSMKKSNNKGQLSPSEVTAIKQLIAGYKESAAFLYRSADELEQLLLQQN